MRLFVREVDRNSTGEGIPAIDPGSMEDLGITAGGFVTVLGEGGIAVAQDRLEQGGERHHESSESTSRRAATKT